MDPVSKAQTPQNRRLLRGGHDPAVGRATRFPAGRSGNPGGRPKHTVSAIYRKWLKKSRNRERVELFLDNTIDPDSKAKMAGVLLIREMTERDEGKVADVVDMNVTGVVALAEVISERRKKRGTAKD